MKHTIRLSANERADQQWNKLLQRRESKAMTDGELKSRAPYGKAYSCPTHPEIGLWGEQGYCPFCGQKMQLQDALVCPNGHGDWFPQILSPRVYCVICGALLQQDKEAQQIQTLASI